MTVKSDHSTMVRIPYHMSDEDVVLEPHVSGSMLDQEMYHLMEHYDFSDEEAMYHVFLGMVLLHEKTGAPLGECLRTAKIWWSG